MSDEQMPAWAREMENRLTRHVLALQVKTESTAQRVEATDHATIKEVGKAIIDSEEHVVARIAELRAEMIRRFDQTHDDLTVNLARADVAIERVQRLEGDVRKELSQLQRRLRELEHWRDHRPEAGQSP